MTEVWTALPGGAESDGWTEQNQPLTERAATRLQVEPIHVQGRLVSASRPPPPSPTPGFRRRSVLELQPDGRKSIGF